MFDMEDKENETQQDNDKKASKLVAEPSGQKPRRSVLKEFDPFAPDSPCPPRQKQKNPDAITIDEEEIFEDAETSLTSYVCPRNKNIEHNSEKKTPKKFANGTRESWLIPDLRDNNQEKPVNPNDTAEMSYVEAVENISQVEGVLSLDKTSSEEDIEFNSIKHSKNPDILVSNSENNLLNMASDIDLNNGVNIMVDSLEHSLDGSGTLNSTIENIQSLVILNKTGPIKVQENSIRIIESTAEQPVNTESICDIETSLFNENETKGFGSMIDSLELPGPHEIAPGLDTTFEENQETLIDSLEIVICEENLEVLNVEEHPSAIKVTNVKDKAQDVIVVNESNDSSCKNLDITFESLSSDTRKSEANLFSSDKPDTAIENQKYSELDKTVSSQGEIPIIVEDSNKIVTSHPDNSSANVDIHATFEAPLPDTIEFKAGQVQDDQINTINTNLGLDKTFESPSSPVQPISDQIITTNVELYKTFETPSTETVEVKTDEVLSDHINALNSNIDLNKIFEGTSLDPVQSKIDQVECGQINTSNLEIHKASETQSSETVEFKADEVLSDHINALNSNIDLNKVFEGTSLDPVQSKIDQVECGQIHTPNLKIHKASETQSSETVEFKADQVLSDHINTLNGNIDPNKAFEGASLDPVQSKIDQVECGQINTSNLEIHKASETPSSETVEFEADQVLSDQINTLNSDIDLNKTFEGPSSHPVQLKNDQIRCDQINTSNVELIKTFEASSLNNDQLKTDEIRSDALCSALEEVSEANDVPIVEKEAATDNKLLDKTFDLDENKPVTEVNSITTIDLINQDEKDVQKVEPHIEQTEDCNSQSILPLKKALEKTSNTTDTLTTENLDKVIATSTELDNTSSKVVENTVAEPTKFELISTQSATNDTHIVQEHSVSLKEIIGIDTIEIRPGNIEQTCSKRPSLTPIGSEDVNSTFITDEEAAESSRVIEALAQSLNQTIDVEESAIADDINSSKSANTSGDLSKEGLNVTIENNEDASTLQTATEDKEHMKSKEKMEEHRNSKTFERKETEEFEDLERQYNENTQNTEKCAMDAIDSLEDVLDKFGEEKVDKVVEQAYSREFSRQDTREFEALERECNENVGNINNCEARKMDYAEPVPKSKDGVIEDIQNKKIIKDEEGSKVVKIQETPDIEDLEQECTANTDTPKDCLDNSKLIKETLLRSDVGVTIVKNDINNRAVVNKANVDDILLEKTDFPEMPDKEQVKVRVSGNICNVNSSSDEIAPSDTKSTIIEQPFTKINFQYDLNQDNSECKSVNYTAQNSAEGTTNGHKESFSKNAVELKEEIPNSTVIKNAQVPKPSENITKPKIRPECRPSTRSLRNKTQVIDNPVLIKDTSKEIKQEKGDNHTNLIPIEFAEKQLNEYKTKSEELKTQVQKLHSEIDTIKNENMRKDKYILTCALEIEAERDNVIQLKKQLENFEKTIAQQNEDLRSLKEEEEKNAMRFTSLEMAFADVFEKYEKTKSIIGQYKTNEEILQRNIQCAEDQLTKLEAKCSVTKEQYSEKLKKVQEQMIQEKEKYRLDIAKLQAMIKRLEIKSSSLETALKQKTEECRALAALCDDITGKPI